MSHCEEQEGWGGGIVAAILIKTQHIKQADFNLSTREPGKASLKFHLRYDLKIRRCYVE